MGIKKVSADGFLSIMIRIGSLAFGFEYNDGRRTIGLKKCDIGEWYFWVGDFALVFWNLKWGRAYAKMLVEYLDQEGLITYE